MNDAGDKRSVAAVGATFFVEGIGVIVDIVISRLNHTVKNGMIVIHAAVDDSHYRPGAGIYAVGIGQVERSCGRLLIEAPDAFFVGEREAALDRLQGIHHVIRVCCNNKRVALHDCSKLFQVSPHGCVKQEDIEL